MNTYQWSAADRQCIDQITGLLYQIKEPGHLSNVHDWVVKLTSGEPNDRKSDYLRLLEYALKSDDGRVGVREPFTSPPPADLLSDPTGWLPPPSAVDRECEQRYAAGGSCGGVDAPDEGSPGEALADLLCRTDSGATPVEKFVADAGPLTCDRGALMSTAAAECLGKFGRTAGAVFDERTEKLCDALAKEQVALMLRYRTNAQRMLTRAQILQDHVRELMPTFQYDEYLKHGDEHVIKVLRAKAGAAGPDAEDAAPASDDDDLDDAAMQQKKMMCALQWLRSEVERADCENVRLVERYDAVVAAIVVASNKKIANDCRAKARKLEVQTELTEVRKEAVKQEALIDCYIGKMSL
ncbi:unnamed protein product [Aphis gossypii]|uniref:DUF4485 domain-containing protein n=1 Tax=Aphis gossypii TaxID=80765 RepID=A0A9P0J8C0_APHGO|nr:unnamed protein product [Aphis gossypii]